MSRFPVRTPVSRRSSSVRLSLGAIALSIGSLAMCLAIGLAAAHAATSRDAETAPRVNARIRAAVDRWRAGEPQPLATRFVHLDTNDRVQVYVHAPGTNEYARAELERLGAYVEHVLPELGLMQARIPLDRVDEIAALPFVDHVTPPSYGVGRMAVTQGDALLHSQELRAAGLDGSGIRIGVLADGIDSIGLSVAAGELPADIQVVGQSGSGDEGTATLEILHDMVPNATLGFCGGQDEAITTADYVTCAEKLQTEFGAQIIVDNVGFYGEPYFEDGAIAKATAEAVANGVLWVSASGNDAESHYQATFSDSGNATHSHDFGGGVTRMPIRIPVAGGNPAAVFLQWGNPFGSVTDEYQACLVDGSGNATACTDWFLGTHDPVQAMDLPCAGPSSCHADLEIRKISGAPQTVEMFLTTAEPSQFNVPGDSIFAQSAVPGVITVNAIDAHDPGLVDAEPFDSQGPCTILFPSPETRAKPELTALDDVTTSGVGRVANPFRGTSAAAPHVAGIAAQLMQGFASLGASGVAATMTSSAVDLGAPGVDSVFGSGRVDALAAAQSLDQAPHGTIAAPASDVTVKKGDSVSFSGTCSDPDGTDGMSFHWDFGNGSGIAPRTTAEAGQATFTAAGTFTVTFTCTDRFQKADPAPPTRHITVSGKSSGGGGGGGCSVARTGSASSDAAGLVMSMLLFGIVRGLRSRGRFKAEWPTISRCRRTRSRR